MQAVRGGVLKSVESGVSKREKTLKKRKGYVVFYKPLIVSLTNKRKKKQIRICDAKGIKFFI